MPVIDHWWQTETGWAIAGNPVGLGPLPVKHGSPTEPMPGCDVQVRRRGGQVVAAGRSARSSSSCRCRPAACRRCGSTTSAASRAYLDEFPGYYKTADAGFIDEDGYIYVMGRTDDIINVAGHRLSTGGMEEMLAGHPDVAECAVIGVKDAMKGEVPLGFLVLKAGVDPPHERDREGDRGAGARKDRSGRRLQARDGGGRLPKTRSGKILRGTMKKIADGEHWKMPATIDDPAILDEIAAALKGRV